MPGPADVLRPGELPRWLEELIDRAEAAGRPVTGIQLMAPPPPPAPPRPARWVA